MQTSINPMLAGLQNNTNHALTANGANVRESTNSKMLDFFSKAGALRGNTELSVRMFDAAYSENPELAVKALFYFRDIRGGQGERANFRAQLLRLVKINPQTVVKNLRNISEYGRWDDILILLKSEAQVKEAVITLIKSQLAEDMKNVEAENGISLLAKWLPTQGAGKESTKQALYIAKKLEITNREYRKIMTTLRAELNIVERMMSRNKWSDIDYSTVPSNAMMQYRKAFARHDEIRFDNFISSVEKGETTINSSTLYPYQIVEKCRGYSSENASLLNAQWNALPDYVSGDGEAENSIAVVDTSGSMGGDPINVAVSLGIYLAERAKGAYKDHFITFSERPKLQQVSGTNIVDKVRNLSRAQWDMNTNLEAVFDLILQVAIDKNLEQDEMLDKLYIISDMQFDSCMRNSSGTMFQHLAKKYESYGYVMPKLVFWNVRATAGNTPMSLDDRGFQNVSGLSPSIFQYVMGGEFKDAYSLMVDVLTSERYADVVL